MVDVVEESHFAVRLDHRGAVDNEYGNRPGEIYLDRLIPIHRRLDLIPIPVRIVAQYPCRQCEWILPPDASMTEVAARAFEQFRRRRAVQINVVGVRENEFHQSQ